MTKKELRTMYDKMSLSEERLTELEKRLDDCFDREPENIGDFEETELMQFSQEYKPSPQRRSPLKIVVTSAAAVAVVAVGVTAAFKTGIIPTGTPVSEFTPNVQTEETAEPTQEAVKHGITSADLPEYPNKGILDSGALTLDSELFDETCVNDIVGANLQDTVLAAALTVTDCDYEWGSGDTVYTVTINTAYYSQMGIDPVGRSIKILMPGRISYQYEGCPLYTKGDRFFAALRNGERFYEVSAAQTIADIITIDGVDYAAAHSKNLPVIYNHAGEDVLIYDRTVTKNPAKYYGIYAIDEYGQYYAGLAEHADNAVETSDDKVDVSMLSFYSDAETLKEIFEPNFYGSWSIQDYDPDWDFSHDISLEYDVSYAFSDIFRPMNGITCGGFSMDSKAFYMLDYTNGANLWVVWKDEPGRLYRYEGVHDRDRSDYLVAYNRRDGIVSPEVSVPSSIGQLGLLKILSEYGDSIEVRAFTNEPKFDEDSLKGTLTEAVMDVLENGSMEYAGVTWKRAHIDRYSVANIDLPEEQNWLLEKSADKLSITVRMFNADEKWRDADYLQDYSGEFYRDFRVDFTRTDSGWSWEISPLSGDPSDIDNFFSPLTDLDIFPPGMDIGETSPEVSVEYYAVDNAGLTDIYALRTIRGASGAVYEYDLYYRDPHTDAYNQLNYSETMDFLVDDDGSVLSASIDESQPRLARYKHGIVTASGVCGSTMAVQGEIELIPHGDFVIVAYNDSDGGRYTVLERSSLFVVGCYQQHLLKITDDSLEVLNEYDGSYTKIELDDELQIRAVEKKAQQLWFNYVVGAPVGTGEYMVITDGYMGRVIADPELRTYQGILNQFKEVYTEKAALDAMSQVIGHSVWEVDGRTFTNDGARGTDISIWSVGFSIPEETKTDSTAVLDFTITYTDFDTYGPSDNQDHYTINAVKTADGWRLDRFYYPY